MKFISALITTLLAIVGSNGPAVDAVYTNEYTNAYTKTHLPFIYQYITPQNNCISFSISEGTGCQWMCNYCANNLGTDNYYFTTDVCTYQEGGCVGTPQTGVTYTCCS